MEAPTVEMHYFIPAVAGKEEPKRLPLLASNRQLRYGSLAYVFSHLSAAPFTRITHVKEAVVKAKMAKKLRDASCVIPKSIYVVETRMDKHGYYYPLVTLDRDELELLNIRKRCCVWEGGGKNPSFAMPAGSAQVIADKEGGRIKPSFVKSKRRVTMEKQACFTIPQHKPVIIAQAEVKSAGNEDVSIWEVRARDNFPRMKLLWNGDNHKRCPDIYYDAVCTALDKANAAPGELMFAE